MNEIKSIVELKKAHQKGWFLTIGDNNVNHTWAVTSNELFMLHDVIHDHMGEILHELEDKKE